MDFYIIITQEFANSLEGIKGIEGYFGYAITNDGRYVCSSNSVNDFPKQFASIVPLTVVALTLSDFPEQTNNIINEI